MGTDQKNSENIVKCPVEDCNYEGLSRGIHLHIRQSSDEKHGPNGEVPDNIDLSNMEVVGKESVDVNYPDKRNVEDVVRLCPFCGRAFNGFHGIKIHLGQKKGQGVHPEDIDIEKNDCPIAHVDQDMNVVEIVEENSLMPSTKRRIINDDSISIERIEEFVTQLDEEGNSEMAERIRNELL